LGQPGVKTPPHAAKVDGGVHQPEFAGRTPSPHEKVRGKEASFLYRPSREKASATVKGGCNVKAKAITEVNLDDDEGASIGHSWTGQDPDDPANRAVDGRKTRSIKGSRGAAVGTGRPKAGQDPDDPADRAGNGPPPEARPDMVPPKSGRGVPVKIVNEDGSSRDKVSLREQRRVRE
jgi:hypothetical protein